VALTTDAAATAREYAAAREDAGWFDLDRALLVASGPLRQKFLHGMLSNDVSGRLAGQGTRAALMDAKGHLLALMRVLVAENEVVMELPAARRDEVHQLLERYRVAAPVRFAAAADVCIGVAGPRAVERLRALGSEAEELALESHRRLEVGGIAVRLARAGDLPANGYVLHVAPDAASRLRETLAGAGFLPLGADVLDVLRIEDGRPWYDRDVTRENLLHETGLVSEYHSPTKGCYVGQEVIARLEARGGNVNRRLRGLRLEAPRPAGTALTSDGKEIGALTTAAVSPRQGAIAMGYVHRSHAEPGTVIDAGGARAEVAALPLAVDGAP